VKIIPFTVAAAISCILSVPAQTQTGSRDEDFRALCAEAVKTPLPAEATLIAVPKKWPECTSYKIYSGIGVEKDYAAARKCAWQERLAAQTHRLDSRDALTDFFGGSAMLAVLYANGEGVKRNIPLALRFACELEGTAAANSEWIDRLQGIDRDISDEEKLNFCEGRYDTFMLNRCGAYVAEIADQRRKDTLSKLMAGWSERQKTEFASLVKAEDEYARAISAFAGNFPESLHVKIAISAEEEAQDEFVADIQQSESGKLPGGTESDYKKADAELNRVYRQTLASMADNAEEAANGGFSEVDKQMAAKDPEYIRNIERAWLKYRDTWVDFARIRYPSISKYAWLSFLTAKQTGVLRGIQAGDYRG
jgi:uncharacterized protein YecT (DUF1311 family)